MFTGIVEGMGDVARIERRGAGRRLWVRAGRVGRSLKKGDSLAVDGVCLTVTAVRAGVAAFDAVEETCRRTTLGLVRPGMRVNLERPLRLNSLLGGHLLQGHVDTAGKIARWAPAGDGKKIWVRIPREYARFLVEKGSVGMDGISLTLVDVTVGTFSVALIPFTLTHTTIGQKRTGEPVNIEIDVIAKMVHQFVVPYLKKSASRRV
ncbi:MAG: riboflavin synthase [Planctomycetota bacterium]